MCGCIAPSLQYFGIELIEIRIKILFLNETKFQFFLNYKHNSMDNNKILAYEARKANPTTVWLLFLFLGWSYGSLGKIGVQILYYLTLGGFGLWTLIRLFTLSGSIKSYNRKIAGQLGLDNQEMALLNLL